MKIQAVTGSLKEIEADALVVGLYAEEQLSGPAAQVDGAIGGQIGRLLASGEINTGSGQVTTILAPAGVKAGQVVCVGLGRRAVLDAGAAFRTAGAASHTLAARPRAKVAYALGDDWKPELHEAAICGAVVGCQADDLYRKEKKRHPIGELLWSHADAATLQSGLLLGECMNFTRRLVDEPADVMYPESFAAEAGHVARDFNLEIDVWGRKRLEDERCGSLLAVAKGSSRDPQLVMVHYRGAKSATAPTLALVGKGVTFDSGGLSIKTNEQMKVMKCDMAGAATVLGAVRAIAGLKLPVNVSGYMGLVENMTGPAAFKLGDVLKSRAGITIEVHNTDAEGRLVLADVLTVANERKPARIVDLATLTGACMVALGENAAGLMTNNQSWCDEVSAAAHEAGEPVWQLPMFEEFAEQISSRVADIKNTGEGRYGGAMTAAKLLERFVGDTPWTHIDIAGPAYAEKPKPWLDGGGTGALLRTLVQLARRAEWV
ncbi:MAG: leucyl aminopeptidase [Planctomycetes bacterium]|nr:leucyl aminopeptidase [Planctomycetota bacterium]